MRVRRATFSLVPPRTSKRSGGATRAEHFGITGLEEGLAAGNKAAHPVENDQDVNIILDATRTEIQRRGQPSEQDV